jgi:hypothetical protein
MGERLATPEVAPVAPELWAASSILMGLKYEAALIERLISEVRGMAESVTIGIFERWGAVKRSKQTLLRLGTELFGEPSEEVKNTIEAISDIARFDELDGRLLKVESWDELLAAPAAKPKKKAPRKKSS